MATDTFYLWRDGPFAPGEVRSMVVRTDSEAGARIIAREYAGTEGPGAWDSADIVRPGGPSYSRTGPVGLVALRGV